MKTILFLIQKEFLQIFRNRSMLPIIFIVPVIQLIVLVNAATFEMQNIRMVYIDKDHSEISRGLISSFEASPFFIVEEQEYSSQEAEDKMHNGNCDLILNIPKDFENKLYKGDNKKVQIEIDAINGTTAGLINAYASSVIAKFNQDLRLELLPELQTQTGGLIKINYSHWYNPQLDYKTFMVPGILVLLVTLISMFLTAMNVVREKEIGTIEQINVTPIKKYQFIIGKLVPFWVIAMFELAFGLVVGKLLFDIPIVGSLGLIFGVASVYLITTLGIGLFMSTLADTQQQAMFIAFFFMMVFILMSGLFTSVESMPEWAQWLNLINPIAYFIEIIRMIMLKGSVFKDIITPFVGLCIYAVVVLSLAVMRYRKTA
ncbi:MAG: ABC transporter permease [Marinilabiliales bacterium]|nr:MAG: ABC transporter permease [Marinilabiliales bacterium]